MSHPVIITFLPFINNLGQRSTVTMTTPTSHTFTHTCMLHEASNEFTRRASVASTDAPKISVQYFYCSTLTIDDPLSPVPPPSSNSANKSFNLPPRPFSVHDNIALEGAWLKIHKRRQSKNNGSGLRVNATKRVTRNQERLAQFTRDAHEEQVLEPPEINSRGFEAMKAIPDSRNDIIYKALGNDTHSTGLGKEHRLASPDLTLRDDPELIPFDETMPVSSREIGNDEFESGIVRQKRSWSPFRRRDKSGKPNDRDDTAPTDPQSPGKHNADFSSSLPERDTSGTPFLRIPSRVRGSRSRPRSRSPEPPQSAPGLGQADGPQSPGDYHPKKSSPLRPTFQASSSSSSNDHEEGSSRLDSGSRRNSLRPKQLKKKAPKEDHVAVGLCRLHMVHMPKLKVSRSSSV